MVKAWAFEFVNIPTDMAEELPAPGVWTRTYDWYQSLWETFEDIGFEGLFFSEHHFMPGRLSPSPNLMIAAIAPRTKNLRLGVMGNVTPLYQPWRLVEEICMLDHLTNGRLELGISSGSGPSEASKLGMSREENRPRFDEILDILDQGLTTGKINADGEYYKFNDLNISLGPLQLPSPRRWMTGLSEPAAAVAATRGYNLCTGFMDCTRTAEVNQAYHAAAADAGIETSADNIALRRMVMISDDGAEAKALNETALNKLRAAMGGKPRPPAISDERAANEAVPDAPRHQRNPISDEDGIAGKPSEVAEQIIEQCRKTGARHFIAFTPNGATRDQIARNYALWRDIVPLLNRADIRQSAA